MILRVNDSGREKVINTAFVSRVFETQEGDGVIIFFPDGHGVFMAGYTIDQAVDLLWPDEKVMR